MTKLGSPVGVEANSCLQLPPLSLYIHVPWCVQKCPYCDFNSHGLKPGQHAQELPEQDYLQALLRDLDADLQFMQQHHVAQRTLHSIFIGGGTPSLMSVDFYQQLFAQLQQRLPFADDIEITMEANPGTWEAGKFEGFTQAGVNRLSIGVQSFDALQLHNLGRIHDPQQAAQAAKTAASCGLNSFNLDLMHGLPQQSVQQALDDLQQAMDLQPPHLSWYQLTLEPNTQFYSKPPKLPDDDTLWHIYDEGHQQLEASGYQRYEVSGYAKAGFQCRHNLNYWRFGDYLGIGCGAHGKLTIPAQQQIVRTTKVKHPKGYLEPGRNALEQREAIANDDLAFEYFLNRARLVEAAPKQEFTDFTGLAWATVADYMQAAEHNGWLTQTETHWQMTNHGLQYLNSFISLFLD